MYIRCIPCGGSGTLLGGGMIRVDCHHCSGKGEVYEEPTPISLLDKDDDRYKEAIASIKALDQSITDDQAAEMFKEELTKLDDSQIKGDKDEQPNNRKSYKKSRKKY